MRAVLIVLLNVLLLSRGFAAPHVHSDCAEATAKHSCEDNHAGLAHFHLSIWREHSHCHGHSHDESNDDRSTSGDARRNNDTVVPDDPRVQDEPCPGASCPCHAGDIVVFADDPLTIGAPRSVVTLPDSIRIAFTADTLGSPHVRSQRRANSLGGTPPWASASPFLYLPHVLRI